MSRELRQLGNVTVMDTIPEDYDRIYLWEIAIIAMDRETHFFISAAFFQRVIIRDELLVTRPLLVVAGHKDLEKLCQRLVVDLDIPGLLAELRQTKVKELHLVSRKEDQDLRKVRLTSALAGALTPPRRWCDHTRRIIQTPQKAIVDVGFLP